MAIACKQSIPTFDVPPPRGDCQVLGDTNDGLTGSEIAYQLQNCRIFSPASFTKGKGRTGTLGRGKWDRRAFLSRGP